MTAQVTDEIAYKGSVWDIRAEPLRPWLKAHGDIRRAFERARPHSANWRGYTANWTVESGNVLLTNVTSDAIRRPDALRQRLPIGAAWISGDLPLLDPKEVMSEVATLIVLTVVNGTVQHERRTSVNLYRGGPGLGIDYKGPRLRPIEHDDSYWGLSSGSDSSFDYDEPSLSPLHDIADRWHLRAALLLAGVDVSIRARRWPKYRTS